MAIQLIFYSSLHFFIATYATAYGFIFGYGRVILSMARSGLFPPVLTRTYGKYQTPYVAILFGSAASYAMVIIVTFVPILGTYLFNVCILSGFFGYVSQLTGFIILRLSHHDQERLFVNPLGIAGAVYPMVVFTFGAISVIGFQGDDQAGIYLIVLDYILFYFYSSCLYYLYIF